MEQYTVRITEEALKDMEDIYRYIAEKLQSPENAIRQYNRIADGILTLETFPERHTVVDFEPERRSGLRRLLVDNYSVFYVIREKQVIVTSVLYSASNIEQRLKERK
ncbi:plasmid stabilisation system protein [Firmicutes bacterium CAG:137]|jgi:toxin ParE1/3/4|nr:plasmid stabilisation system protein [Firmicutes bacterium CAG:137]